MERVITYAGGSININVPMPGIYTLGIDSATGKSYLAYILKLVDDENSEVITSDSKKVILLKIEEFTKSDKSILFIDRFDFIMDKEIVSRLLSIRDRYIFIDYKDNNYNDLLDAKYCIFTSRKDGFSLYA